MKTKYVVLSLLLILSIAAGSFAGCGGQQTPQQNQQNQQGQQQQPGPAQGQPNQTTPPETTPEVKTTASIVDTEAAFLTAASNKGSWIIAITKDLTVSKNIVLEGEFKNGKKDADGKDIIQRKVALYAQDEKRNITARYTLTAPQLAVLSPMASIQHGTFKGDVYVTASNFQLIDTTVDGNLYFTTDEAKATFKMDGTSKVTGKQEMRKS